MAGEHAWYVDSSDIITHEQVITGRRGAQREAAAHVERILGRLAQREREFVEAMAQVPAEQRKLARIAIDAGHSKAPEAGPTSRRLDTVRGIIDRGRLYTFRHRAIEAYLTSSWSSVE